MSQKPDWLRTHGKPWGRTGDERLIYDNPWIRVTEYDAVAPTGRPALYGLVHMKNLAMAVLPIHDDGTIVLVGQNRFALADYSWEIPEGGGKLDVEPLTSAKRELSEETGLQADHWQEVLRAQLSNSITDERAVGFLAWGLSPCREGHQADDTEELVMARVPFREALDAAVAGHLQDVLTLAMLLRAYHMAREGALPGEMARAMLG